MTSDDLLALSDANHAEFCREQARFLTPYQLEEDEAVLFTSSGTRFPAGPSNCVLPIGEAAADPDAVLARARAWFGAKNRGYTVYVRAHRDEALGRACEKAGFARLANSPGMVLTERLSPPSSAVSIRKVDGEEATAHFVHVTATAFDTIGMPADATRRVFSQPRRWLGPRWHVEVAYQGDEPVAAAMLLFSHGIAGVYWVGTVPNARGKGFAEAIMRSVSNRAFDRGAPAVFLQASPYGEPLYRRLGYREITKYPWYLVPREAASA